MYGCKHIEDQGTRTTLASLSNQTKLNPIKKAGCMPALASRLRLTRHADAAGWPSLPAAGQSRCAGGSSSAMGAWGLDLQPQAHCPLLHGSRWLSPALHAPSQAPAVGPQAHGCCASWAAAQVLRHSCRQSRSCFRQDSSAALCAAAAAAPTDEGHPLHKPWLEEVEGRVTAATAALLAAAPELGDTAPPATAAAAARSALSTKAGVASCVEERISRARSSAGTIQHARALAPGMRRAGMSPPHEVPWTGVPSCAVSQHHSVAAPASGRHCADSAWRDERGQDEVQDGLVCRRGGGGPAHSVLSSSSSSRCLPTAHAL
eukprot:726752-Pelagomonas_calceolata.AAC.4